MKEFWKWAINRIKSYEEIKSTCFRMSFTSTTHEYNNPLLIETWLGVCYLNRFSQKTFLISWYYNSYITTFRIILFFFCIFSRLENAASNKVIVLNFDNNMIQTIGPKPFQAFENLFEISIRSNFISDIPKGE